MSAPSSPNPNSRAIVMSSSCIDFKVSEFAEAWLDSTTQEEKFLNNFVHFWILQVDSVPDSPNAQG